MAEELQNLLERIQKDGVDKAQAQADEIVSAAKQDAKRIVAEAESEAQRIVEKAEEDGKAFAERAEQSVLQAARDVIISVGEAVTNMFRNLVREQVSEAMTVDTLKEMIVNVVDTYCSASTASGHVDILVSEEQKEKIAEFFMAKFAKQAADRVEIKGDPDVIAGFSVVVTDNNVEHDFSDEAITEALCELLRPRIAEIVRTGLEDKGK